MMKVTDEEKDKTGKNKGRPDENGKLQKNREKRNNSRGYVLSIFIIPGLLVAALYLPGVILETQDNSRMSYTAVEKRESLDVSYVNSEYEKNMYDRMYYLAGMDKNRMTVSSITYDEENKETQKKQLQEIVKQEWIYRLMEMVPYFYGTLFEYFEYPEYLEIRQCKKYVVYGTEDRKSGQNEERIALVLWYYDLGIKWDTDSRIQLLVDSETDSIYYIRMTTDTPAVNESGKSRETDIYEGDKFDAVSIATLDNSTMLQEFQTRLGYHHYYYNEYYEAEVHGGQVDMPLAEDNQSVIVFKLPYGELSLQFLFQADFQKGVKPDISMGIAEIGNLIPEMMQN